MGGQWLFDKTHAFPGDGMGAGEMLSDMQKGRLGLNPMDGQLQQREGGKLCVCVSPAMFDISNIVFPDIRSAPERIPFFPSHRHTQGAKHDTAPLSEEPDGVIQYPEIRDQRFRDQREMRDPGSIRGWGREAWQPWQAWQSTMAPIPE